MTNPPTPPEPSDGPQHGEPGAAEPGPEQSSPEQPTTPMPTTPTAPMPTTGSPPAAAPWQRPEVAPTAEVPAPLPPTPADPTLGGYDPYGRPADGATTTDGTASGYGQHGGGPQAVEGVASYGWASEPVHGAPGQAPGAHPAAWQPALVGAPGAPPTRSRTPLILGIVAAVVVVVVVAVILLTVAAGNRREEEALARAEGAAAAVESVFQAIVDGDAAAALEHVDQTGTSTDLVTDEVLAASTALAPITDVVVTPPDEIEESTRSGEVDVTYLLGDTEVSQSYQVRDPEDDGSWVVDGVLAEASLTLPAGIEVLLNGVAVTEPEIALLPGAYEVTTPARYFTLGEGAFTVTELYFAEAPYLEPALSEAGVAAFQEAVTSSAEACLRSKDLESGCGLDVPRVLSDDTVLTEGTLTRTLAPEARATLEAMAGTPRPDEPTLVQGESVGAVEITADCAKGGQTGTCTVLRGPSLGTPTVDMADPELAVTWE